MTKYSKKSAVSRRAFLRVMGGVVALVAGNGACPAMDAFAQENPTGYPLPDEKIEAVLKRLFGSRTPNAGDGKIKLELPLIAEDGGNVAVTIEADLPMTPASYVKHIYIISDKNRRPLIAKFSLTPEAGKAYIGTHIRLADTTDVRAVAEMNDGTLYAASRNVRVTISGCGDLPPQN